ncbi:MAG: hypothetical protein L0322_27190 [Chloroflexi bacterium]|nr:hypothetical protein [Chloroflexota bacterium]
MLFKNIIGLNVAWPSALGELGRLALALLAVLAGVIVIGFMEQQVWPWRSLLQLVAAVAAIGLACLTLTWRVGASWRRKHLAGVAILLAVLLAGAAGLEIFFRARPGFIPRQVMNQLPGSGEYLRRDVFVFDSPIQLGRRLKPGQNGWIEGRAMEVVTWNGRERFRYLDMASAQVNRIHFITDENGFRNDPPLSATYDVVVLGDSYTVGSEVQEPWPVLLAQQSDLSVLNLAIFGFGPQAESQALQLYGLPRSPRVVILAYFEGNDLRDAALYERVHAQGLGLPEYWVSETGWDRSLVVLTWARLSAAQLAWRLGLPAAAKSARTQAVPVYPLELTLNGRLLRLNFLDGYVAMLAASQAEIVASENYRLAATALLEAREAAENRGARFILVYIPSKVHVYLPQASPELIEPITSSSGRVTLGDEGFLSVAADSRGLGAAEFLDRIDDQALVLEALAEANGIEFINLTPSFQAEARQGRELYLSLATHWNEQGHQLAAEIVARYLGEP